MEIDQHINKDSTWIIVYPRGDHDRLAIVEICAGMEYEINDYALASRQQFLGDPYEAFKYAKELASQNNLELDKLDGLHNYLD